MAKMKKEDIKELSTEEIVQKISDQKQHYMKLKFNHTVSAIDNPLVLKSMRKDIARLSTELSARKNAEN